MFITKFISAMLIIAIIQIAITIYIFYLLIKYLKNKEGK